MIQKSGNVCANSTNVLIEFSSDSVLAPCQNILIILIKSGVLALCRLIACTSPGLIIARCGNSPGARLPHLCSLSPPCTSAGLLRCEFALGSRLPRPRTEDHQG